MLSCNKRWTPNLYNHVGNSPNLIRQHCCRWIFQSFDALSERSITLWTILNLLWVNCTFCHRCELMNRTIVNDHSLPYDCWKFWGVIFTLILMKRPKREPNLRLIFLCSIERLCFSCLLVGCLTLVWLSVIFSISIVKNEITSAS